MLQLVDGTLLPEGRIIKAAEYQAVLDGEAVIADAHRQAAEILAKAELEYAARKQQGYDDGLQEGRLEMAEKMLDTVASSVDFLSSLESRVVQLVTRVVRKILGDMQQPDRITAVVRNALAVARNETRVTLRVCPGDLETVQDRLREIMQPYPAINFLDVMADSRLRADGCVLETDIGVVDASLDVQLEAIEKSLLKSVSGSANP